MRKSIIAVIAAMTVCMSFNSFAGQSQPVPAAGIVYVNNNETKAPAKTAEPEKKAETKVETSQKKAEEKKKETVTKEAEKAKEQAKTPAKEQTKKVTTKKK